MKKRLVIYDFDGTIFFSPNKDQGVEIYKNHGKNWMHIGWWGKKESLEPPIVEIKPVDSQYNQKVLNSFYKDRKDENSLVVLMTGRAYFFESRIKEICENKGIFFDFYFFDGSPGCHGKSTLEKKLNRIEDLIHENLEVLEIWEDRPEHIIGFSEKIAFWKEKCPKLNVVEIHDAN
jgi:hypothetical protein